MKYLLLILVTCVACSKGSEKDNQRHEKPNTAGEIATQDEHEVEPGLPSKPKLEEDKPRAEDPNHRSSEKETREPRIYRPILQDDHENPYARVNSNFENLCIAGTLSGNMDPIIQGLMENAQEISNCFKAWDKLKTTETINLFGFPLNDLSILDGLNPQSLAISPSQALDLSPLNKMKRLRNLRVVFPSSAAVTELLNYRDATWKVLENDFSANFPELDVLTDALLQDVLDLAEQIAVVKEQILISQGIEQLPLISKRDLLTQQWDEAKSKMIREGRAMQMPKLRRIYVRECLNPATEALDAAIAASRTSIKVNGEFLKDLPLLESVQIQGAQIGAMPFSSLGNLKRLVLDYSGLENMHRIAELEGLQTLYMTYSQIKNIDFLAGLENLKYLDLNFNHIAIGEDSVFFQILPQLEDYEILEQILPTAHTDAEEESSPFALPCLQPIPF